MTLTNAIQRAYRRAMITRSTWFVVRTGNRYHVTDWYMSGEVILCTAD